MKKLVIAMLLGVFAVVYGQPYEPVNIWHRCGTRYYEQFGCRIAGVGDQNGDGYEDFIIGQPGFPGEMTWNVVGLYYGGDPPDTTLDVLFERWADSVWCGEVANVGDVNGDGGIDIALSQTRSFIWNKVAIYYGGSAFDTIPDLILNEPSAEYSDLYGRDVEGLGDVNGDGFDDMAVHAPSYDHQRGKVWVYFGGSPMDTIADWEKVGVSQTVYFGNSIAGKGDLNGDGYDDFAVYEWTGYPSHAETNYYVFLGSSELDTIPDLVIYGEHYYPEIDLASSLAMICNLNGDTYSDLVISASGTANVVVFYGSPSMNTEIDLILQGFETPLPGGGSGIIVSATGDVNADGFDDILASQPHSNDYAGRILVYFGGPWMDGQPDIQYIGYGQPGHGYGRTLAECGDVNGDGVDDIIFGSWDPGINTEGCVDIWAGDSTWVVNVPTENPEPVPNLFHLYPPYPNPFNTQLTIPFEVLPGISNQARLKICNILGEEVIDLTNQVGRSDLSPTLSRKELIWNGRNTQGLDCTSGIYFVILQVGENREVQKAVLLR